MSKCSTPSVLIIEDGGEILVQSPDQVTIGLYAGENAIGTNLGFLIDPNDTPLGISTSSATISHALSFGKADAVTIFAKTCTVADAAATFFCNAVVGEDVPESINSALTFLPQYLPQGCPRGIYCP